MKGWWIFARAAWSLGWRPVVFRLNPLQMEWVMPNGFLVFVRAVRDV